MQELSKTLLQSLPNLRVRESSPVIIIVIIIAVIIIMIIIFLEDRIWSTRQSHDQVNQTVQAGQQVTYKMLMS